MQESTRCQAILWIGGCWWLWSSLMQMMRIGTKSFVAVICKWCWKWIQTFWIFVCWRFQFFIILEIMVWPKFQNFCSQLVDIGSGIDLQRQCLYHCSFITWSLWVELVAEVNVAIDSTYLLCHWHRRIIWLKQVRNVLCVRSGTK